MDRQFEIAATEISRCLAMCSSVLAERRNRCLEFSMYFKHVYYFLTMLNSLLTGKLYHNIREILVNTTLKSLKDCIEHQLETEYFVNAVFKLLDYLVLKQDIEVVCPIKDLQEKADSYQSVAEVFMRIQIQNPQIKAQRREGEDTDESCKNLKHLEAEAIEQWLSEEKRPEVLEILKTVFRTTKRFEEEHDVVLTTSEAVASLQVSNCL